jgi:hypothetical protein
MWEMYMKGGAKMSRDEIRFKIKHLESVLSKAKENEREGIPISRVPVSALINRKIESLRAMLKE